MADLFSGLIDLFRSGDRTVAASNYVARKTGIAVPVAGTNDPVEVEFSRLLQMDNAAQAEADHMILEDKKMADQGAGLGQATLRGKIRQRLDPVEKGYRDFIAAHPGHSRARIAYGSFLSDLGREDEARAQWEKAGDLDPKNPSVWNQLANYYGHNSPVKKAFECYERAIALATNEPVYYENLATTVYLFRMDATNHYGITEQQVFDKAMGLYEKALELDPENFPLATKLAQTYYGIKPPRIEAAFKAWQAALRLARDDIEREGIRLHLARWHKTAGDPEAARRELNLVTNVMYAITRTNILRSIEREGGSRPAAGRKAE
jgi:tetratricopeptide (TPR) repeat protein